VSIRPTRAGRPRQSTDVCREAPSRGSPTWRRRWGNVGQRARSKLSRSRKLVEHQG
jgi:hypothetical protein